MMWTELEEGKGSLLLPFVFVSFYVGKKHSAVVASRHGVASCATNVRSPTTIGASVRKISHFIFS